MMCMKYEQIFYLAWTWGHFLQNWLRVNISMVYGTNVASRVCPTWDKNGQKIMKMLVCCDIDNLGGVFCGKQFAGV